MNNKEISRMNDYFARYLLGQRENEPLLLNFINAVMRDNDLEEFASVTVTNPYNLKEHSTESETIVDVKAITSSGEKVIIEVQVQGNKTFFDRVLEYWARTYRAERIKNENGIEVRRFMPVISINIVDFTMFDDIDFAHTSHMIHCVQNKKVSNDKLEIHFLELPKMHMAVKEDELKTWLSYFGSKDFEREKDVIAMRGEVFKKAVGDYEYFVSDSDLISEYEKREIFLNGQAAALDYERYEARQEGLKEGRAEGRVQGHAEGHKEGLEQGIVQGVLQEKIKLAKSALAKGLEIQTIVELTGLSEQEIKNLQ